MEYREDHNYKTPFYMTYPMQNMYLTEMEYEKDMERMKELYPREVRELQAMIERRCDEMEYEGSRMYDENPDRYMLEEEARRLYERFIRENPQYHVMMPSCSECPMEPGIRPPRPEMPMEPGMRPSRPEMPMKPGMRPPRPIEPRNISQANDMQMQQFGGRQEDSWLRSLISILFHDEIYRRRCRNRRCRRWW